MNNRVRSLFASVRTDDKNFELKPLKAGLRGGPDVYVSWKSHTQTYDDAARLMRISLYDPVIGEKPGYHEEYPPLDESDVATLCVAESLADTNEPWLYGLQAIIPDENGHDRYADVSVSDEPWKEEDKDPSEPPIRETAYEMYKAQWTLENLTQDMLLDAMRNWAEESREFGNRSSFEDWAEETGFGYGSCYVCYDEFLGAEYQDEDYMKELLGSDALIKEYAADKERSSLSAGLGIREGPAPAPKDPKPYYFTFGTDGKYPFSDTYIVVNALTRHDAVEMFRQLYPDRDDYGTVNCAFIYDEHDAKAAVLPYYPDGATAIIEKDEKGNVVEKLNFGRDELEKEKIMLEDEDEMER